MNRFTVLPPLSLYIHMPWCTKTCPFCDFNAYTAPQQLPEAEYIAALIRDARIDQPYAQGRQISACFIGGGTPSLFSPQAYNTLFEALRDLFDWQADAEITMEVNPGSCSAEWLVAYRKIGINRISIGAQSFSDKSLSLLKRDHSVAEIREMFDMVRQAGFDNINIDLMYGLPAQSYEEAINDVQAAIALLPEHLSWYQLSIEPNTVFHKQPPARLPESHALNQLESEVEHLLPAAGYERYEVSAYQSNDQYSRYNRQVWEFGDYIGLGAGAHGKISYLDSSELIRIQKTRGPKDYLAATVYNKRLAAHIAEADRMLEFMLNGLRLTQGVPRAWFEDRTAVPLAFAQASIDQAISRGWLLDHPTQLVTSTEGLRRLNDVLVDCFM